MRNAMLTRGQNSYAAVLPPRAIGSGNRIQLYDPAVSAMNDFTREYPVTVDEDRQIGAALYMAEKTASVHVSRILSKLGVQSRTQAAAVAHRLHLG